MASGSTSGRRSFAEKGPDGGSNVHADARGNAYVVGTTFGGTLPGQTLIGARDAFIRKYDRHGNVVWTRQYGTTADDNAESVTGDDSGIYVCGRSVGIFPGQLSNGSYVRKLDFDGNEIWTRQFTSGTFDSCFGVALDEAGDVFIVGRADGTLPGQTSQGGFSDAYIRKYDGSGNELWTRQFGSSDFEFGGGVSVDEGGAAWVTGYTQEGNGPTPRTGFLEGTGVECLSASVRSEAKEMPEKDDTLSLGPDKEKPVSGSPLEAAPERIGPYRMLKKLGEGGMGVVYLAEQERPIRRRVALKVIKLGMDTQQVIARFEAERQTLALMNHPNVAAVFDAGATDQGRPYFVMERVEGVPITVHCDRKRLTTRERLELFTQVCEGVEHAHQKGIIHRDIKPSNVLVASEGVKPVPKIIDFGVAKATAHRQSEQPVSTRLGQVMGTPEYMSPEQAAGTSEDIDTRTDVYALGAMLYELLVGARPFDSEGLRTDGFHELFRMIQEDEPSKPSTRLTKLGERCAELAGRRRSDPIGLARQLRGDLDWITMKALEKDRARRYASPNELATDLRRHLKHEPVSASPPGAAYRMGKFVRRHRLGVLAGTVVLLAVATGAVGLALGLVRAVRAEDEARREAVIAKQVSEFLVGLFAIDDASEERVNAVTALEILDRGADKLGRELDEDPLIQARLLTTIGRVYSSLRRYDEAGLLLTRAFETYRTVLGREHPETLRSMQNLAWARAARAGTRSEATRLYSELLEIRRELHGSDHGETIDAMTMLANVYQMQERFAEAETLLLQAIEAGKLTLGDDDPATLHATFILGCVYFQQRRYDEAARLRQEVLENKRRSLGAEHEATLNSAQMLADTFQAQGRFEEAERLQVEVLDTQRRVNGEDHPATLRSMKTLAGLYRSLERYEEAERLYRNALEGQRRVLGEVNPDTLATTYLLGEALKQQGRFDEAEQIYVNTLESLQRTVGGEHRFTLWYRDLLADVR